MKVWRTAMTAPVWLYQKLVSPIFPSRCIYSPSCSEYTRRAVLRYGVAGLLLGLARVLRCIGGLYRGGDDQVPEKFTLKYLFGSYRTYWSGRGQD